MADGCGPICQADNVLYPVTFQGFTLNKAFIKLAEFPISQAEMDELPDDQKALWAVVCHAVTELKIFARVYISNAHIADGEAPISMAILIQRHAILRVWSAKLFELVECVLGLSRQGPSVEVSVSSLAAKMHQKYEKNVQGSDHSLVARIRNESTNHYSFKAAKKNLKHVGDGANCTMYLHDMTGNSFYPYGEEVMFMGRINQYGSSLGNSEEKLDLLKNWFDWNLRANEWSDALHLECFKQFIRPKIQGRVPQEKVYWVEEGLVGDIESAKAPLFYRKTRPQ